MEEPVTYIFLVKDDPEDGGNRFLGNISIYLTDCMVSQVLFITYKISPCMILFVRRSVNNVS